MPVEEIGKDFELLLTEYPVTAYLDSREALIKWMHFIHNKINEKLEKPKITLNEFYNKYYEEYKPKDIKLKNYYKWKEKILYILVLLGASGLIVYLYNK
jgi:exonuclease I